MERTDRSISEQICAYHATLLQGGLPKEVTAYAKKTVLDYLGCLIAGSAAEAGVRTRNAFAAHAGSGVCTVVGADFETNAETAAFINGCAGHALEMDDTIYEAGGHIAVNAVPAAIAVAEETDADGMRFLEAMVLAYDMMTRVGRGEIPDNCFERGWHPTSVNGIFAAVVAVGHLLGLTREQMVSAVGIAEGFASGSLVCYEDGSMTKPLNPANAAMSAIVAARLATAGYTGPKWAFEGKRGFLRKYTDDGKGVPERMLEDLDHPEYLILRASFKPYACCRYNHSPIDSVIGLVKEHGIRPEQIRKITVDVCRLAVRGVVEPREIKYHPTTVLGAQFSLPYAVAVAALFGDASVKEHREELLTDERVQRLMSLTEMTHTGEMDQYLPENTAANVTIDLEDGNRFSRLTKYNKGDIQNPFTDEELKQKYLSLTSDITGEQKALSLYDAVMRLDRIRVRALTACL